MWPLRIQIVESVAAEYCDNVSSRGELRALVASWFSLALLSNHSPQVPRTVCLNHFLTSVFPILDLLEYRHTSGILQVPFQSTATKRVNGFFGFPWHV